MRGIYTTTSDPERIVYVPVGLDGRAGVPDVGGPWPGGPGGGLMSALSAMIKAVSAPAAWKTVPTEALKWQLPL